VALANKADLTALGLNAHLRPFFQIHDPAVIEKMFRTRGRIGIGEDDRALIDRGHRLDELTHIRLGPTAPDEVRGQIRIALTTLGIPVPKIDKSDIPYRSTR
jgi:hypothetical protein